MTDSNDDKRKGRPPGRSDRGRPSSGDRPRDRREAASAPSAPVATTIARASRRDGGDKPFRSRRSADKPFRPRAEGGATGLSAAVTSDDRPRVPKAATRALPNRDGE